MAQVQVRALDGSSFESYLALPKNNTGPGLLLIHEIFGLSPFVKSVCDTYADLGYVVLCPNLFWRQVELKNLSGTDGQPDWDQALKLYKSFDIESGVRDLLASVAHLRQMKECAGRVGALGFCLGCRLAYLLAARSDIDCAVGYYGVGLDSFLDEVHDIRVPLMLHFGDQDVLTPPFLKSKVLKALEKNPNILTHLYPMAEHGFARENDPKYHEDSALKARARTQAFLEEHLFD